MRFILFFLIAAGLPMGLHAKNTPTRGLFVDKLPLLLTDATEQAGFFHDLKTQGFNYLVLYDLHKVFASTDLTEKLSEFISNCRLNGVNTVCAAGETSSFFSEKVVPYQNKAPEGSAFDNFYLEFEFWRGGEAKEGGMYHSYIQKNNLPADTTGLFSFYRDQLTSLQKIAGQQGVETSTYVGWLNQGQADFIASKTNQVWVHAYYKNPAGLFSYSRSRLNMFSQGNAKVYPIFSAENEFSGPWVEKSTHVEDLYLDFSHQASAERNTLFSDGYMWFSQSQLRSRLKRNTFAGTL